MKQIFWQPKALRQLRKMQEKEAKDNVYDAVEALSHFPNCPKIRKLRGREAYRLRIKGWRVIFRVTSNTITIEEIKKRDEHTY
ncbi:MAG: type II toxin-antitoxin system RelE/ParE family toxin [Candidatus Aminicenantes bacterium]|nr:type II toxin-antitoxin system RelE/ParE family toxin [Candidatus Aminicenantes bacterium]